MMSKRIVKMVMRSIGANKGWAWARTLCFTYMDLDVFCFLFCFWLFVNNNV